MTNYDLLIIDTIETSEYIKGDLSDDDVAIPTHMIPPNPDESDILPSQMHPSYPYGNPNHKKHPAAKPRAIYDPHSRALFEDMRYGGGGVNGSLRWKDLALEELLPVDEAREEAKRAMQARKMASGASNNNPQAQQHPNQAPQAQPAEEDDDDDEDENDENVNESIDDDDEDDEGEEETEEEGGIDDEESDEYGE
ncbi:hypothetical protein NLJ89_g4215 [Agrocybe chaxingu]|uniref:Uncharacterized protein n=1 Tax=Agrocybe chaxingu TaxID=84603 RepID=A0A9W8K340_9AGAR|nr:hypothetical protein NLJ89_g4215 [Agrocybe chaxingu]